MFNCVLQHFKKFQKVSFDEGKQTKVYIWQTHANHFSEE